MKEYRKARQIAEDIVFCSRKTLTLEEKELLKKSPFSDILSVVEKPNFLKLVEKEIDKIHKNEMVEDDNKNVKKEEKVDSKNNSLVIKKKNKYFTGIERGELLELLASIEDHFELEVPYNYSKIELEALKKFIEDHAEKEIFDDQTKALAMKIKDKNSPEEIMGTLRLYIGR